MDEITLPWFGELYYSLCEYKSESISQDILFPWVKNAKHLMERLAPYGKIEAKLWRPEEEEEVEDDLYRWYALSRVSDLLLLTLQSEKGEYDLGLLNRNLPVRSLPFLRPKVELEDYLHFFTELGMHTCDYPTFHPFYHEIVEVEQTEDPNVPIEILEVFWPGLLFGQLLFSRAGVKVRGGGKSISKELAEQSTLYFTYVRRHRPTSDLSHGWGHNSQWRTTFRRDYTDDSFFYYHVDGKYDLSRPDWTMEKRELTTAKFLSRAERIELLVNRCLIITQKVDDVEKHSSPYNDRYIEQKK
jgi:hypothetical protein